MEIIILICLLIIIALLLQDKIVVSKKVRQKTTLEKHNQNLPDIMGQPKLARSQVVPADANQSQLQEEESNSDNFDIEYDENENVGIQIPQEELDDVFRNGPDLEEEEEEWNTYGINDGNDGFAQGVTFEELGAVGMLLQQDALQPSQRETAVNIVHKIQGTELLSLLENSIQGVSRKIADLLDGSLSSESDFGSSSVRKNDLSGFDIGDFV